MGGSSSKTYYAPIDTLFQDYGCVALDSSDRMANRIGKAPFYNVNFDIKNWGGTNSSTSRATYDDMIDGVVTAITGVSKAIGGKIKGPVFLLTAYDPLRPP